MQFNSNQHGNKYQFQHGHKGDSVHKNFLTFDGENACIIQGLSYQVIHNKRIIKDAGETGNWGLETRM